MNLSHVIEKRIEKYGKNFIVAVSGGVDSMTLLDATRKIPGIKLVVCHVNYNLRKESVKDLDLVKKYCYKNELTFYKHEVYEEIKGNIQGQARIIRYNFFKKISKLTGIHNVLVGHHREDNIETFLLQKQRQVIVTHYGLKDCREILGLNIVRPMLSVSKENLKIYAIINKVQWLEDQTNKKNDYKRNLLRNTVLKNMNWIKKFLIIQKINLLNSKNKIIFKKVEEVYTDLIEENKIEQRLFSQPNEIIKMVLYKYLKDNGYPIGRINKKIISEIISYNNKTKSSVASLDLAKDFKLKKERQKYYIVKGKQNE